LLCRNDAIVLHADIQALRHIEFAVALGAGIGFDGIDTLERLDGFGRTDRLAVTAGGTNISYNG
jgi:hypothetical protein